MALGCSMASWPAAPTAGRAGHHSTEHTITLSINSNDHLAKSTSPAEMTCNLWTSGPLALSTSRPLDECPGDAEPSRKKSREFRRTLGPLYGHQAIGATRRNDVEPLDLWTSQSLDLSTSRPLDECPGGRRLYKKSPRVPAYPWATIWPSGYRRQPQI